MYVQIHDHVPVCFECQMDDETTAFCTVIDGLEAVLCLDGKFVAGQIIDDILLNRWRNTIGEEIQGIFAFACDDIEGAVMALFACDELGVLSVVVDLLCSEEPGIIRLLEEFGDLRIREGTIGSFEKR